MQFSVRKSATRLLRSHALACVLVLFFALANAPRAFAAATVSTTVYVDANNNGIKDGTESAPTGTLYAKLISGGSVVNVAAVISGTASFGTVANGTYTVILDTNNSLSFSSATLPAGYMFANPSTGSLPLSITTTTTQTLAFGVTPAIAGNVYLDANDNGVFDAGEVGPAATYVKLVSSGNVVAQVAAVNSSTGAYSFGNVAAGSYTIRIDDNNSVADPNVSAPAGFAFKNPASGSVSVNVANAPLTAQNLGMQTVITGRVYVDLDNSSSYTSLSDTLLPSTVPVYLKLISGGAVISIASSNSSTGIYTFINVPAGTYNLVLDSNSSSTDSTPTPPAGYSFRNTPTGIEVPIVTANTGVSGYDFGVIAEGSCVCGFSDGRYTQATINIDGDMSDWAAVTADPDNNSCDPLGNADHDAPIQSTGRDILEIAVSYDNANVYMFTRRAGSSSNTDRFIYYHDADADGKMETGERVVVAAWQGSNQTVGLTVFSYNAVAPGGDPIVDTATGVGDGYRLPGTLTQIQSLPAANGRGNLDGTRMEWAVPWALLNSSPGRPILFHTSSTNSQPGSGSFPAQVDDNIGGCNSCFVNNQTGGLSFAPDHTNQLPLALPATTNYYPHVITNTGNGVDSVNLSTTGVGPWTANSITYYKDLGTIGTYQAGTDVQLTDTNGDGIVDTGALIAGASINILVAITTPATPSGTTTFSTKATSTFVPGCSTNSGYVKPNATAVDVVATGDRTISGTIFEDIAGTGASTGNARSGVNVRLYLDANDNGVVDAADTFMAATTTDLSGIYTFYVSSTLQGVKYLVAVDSKSVTPSGGLRAGFSQSDVWAEQTYGDNSASVAFDLAPRFGGRTPAASDSYDTLNPASGSNVYKHLARVDLSSGSVTNANFGFSFNVVTNTRAGDAADDDTASNRTVQGSFRQFLQNARAINGANAMRFVPAVPTNASGAGGTFWSISVSSALPLIDDAGTIIDGTAYSFTDGTTMRDTNTGSLGSGGTVGTDAITLAQVARPELEIVEVRATAVIPIGLDISGSSSAVRNIALYGFGSAANSNTSGNIVVETTASSAVIESNIIGSGASAFSDPSGNRSLGDNIRILGTASVTVRNNLIGFSSGNGVDVAATSSSFSFTGNEVRGNGIGNTLMGLADRSPSGVIRANLFIANTGAGVDTFGSTGSNSIPNNTVTGNGVGTDYPGMRIAGNGSSIDRNIISANYGSGVLVASSLASVGTSNTITRNSIYQNGNVGTAVSGRIGIDLLVSGNDQSTGSSPFVTINDSGDSDSGANGLLNFPVITSAIVTGSNIDIVGYARPGASIEFFIADVAPNYFGQGKTYLTTLVEGSSSDTDGTTGIYGPAAVNGILQGTDDTNKFKFTFPVPAGVSIGSYLTVTATISNNTSEFSGVVQVIGNGTTVSGNVYVDSNHNGLYDANPAEDWASGPAVFVNLVSSGVVVKSAPVTAGSGFYSFSTVLAGAYTMVVTNSATNTAPVAPAGYSFIQPSNGTLNITVGNSGLSNQYFGLFSGSTVAGTVFTDNGLGGGTANDGAKNGGEPGLAGVTVYLTDAGGSTIYSSTTSNSAGAFSLYIPGTLTAPVVAITNPTSHVNTGGNVGTTAGIYNNVTARIAFTSTNGSAYTGLLFGLVPPNTFDASGELASAPGTAVVFPHIYTPATVGTVTFATSANTTPSTSGFAQILYRDVACNGVVDPTDPVVSAAIATTPGTPICLLIKDFIPVAAPIGTLDSLTIVAAFTYANNGTLSTPSSSLVVHDLTRVDVQSSALKLVKSVSATAALPGATLTYTLDFFNAGATPISNLIIFDSTPAYTVFVSATCPATLPPNLSGCSLVTPAVNAAGNMSWTFSGTLLSGQSGTVTFLTKVQ